MSVENHRVKDLNCGVAGAITARYYKGIAADGDNMVLELWKK